MADISKIRLKNETYNIKDETARNNVTEINNRIDNLNNKNFVIIGDSWSTTDTPNINHFADWLDDLIVSLKYNSSHVFRYANGGAGWVSNGNSGNFLTQLNNAIDNMSQEQKNNTDRILMFGGINDVSNNVSYQLIQDYIRSCVTLAKQNFPNATLYVCPLNIPGHKYSNIKLAIETYHRELVLWAKSNFSQICVFDMIDWLIPFEPFKPFTENDELHLSILGNNIFGNCMLNLMKGLPITNDIIYYLNSVSNVSQINNDYMKAKLVISNNSQNYQFFYIKLLQSVSNDQTITIATMPFSSSLRPYYWESLSPINSVAFVDYKVVGMLSIDYETGELKFINTSGTSINANTELKCSPLISNLY